MGKASLYQTFFLTVSLKCSSGGNQESEREISGSNKIKAKQWKRQCRESYLKFPHHSSFFWKLFLGLARKKYSFYLIYYSSDQSSSYLIYLYSVHNIVYINCLLVLFREPEHDPQAKLNVNKQWQVKTPTGRKPLSQMVARKTSPLRGKKPWGWPGSWGDPHHRDDYQKWNRTELIFSAYTSKTT